MIEPHSSVAACVLAAGQSTRMGDLNKMLITLNGKTLLQHVLNAIESSAIDEIFVITGYQSRQVSESISAFDVKLVENAAYSQGMSTSIKIAIENLAKHIDGALICLGDMPVVSAYTINKIVAAFSQSGKIIVPTCLGQQGNPVLWPRSYFTELSNLKGDRGAKYLLKKYPAQVNRLDVGNAGIVFDVDDMPSLELMRSKFNF